MMRSRSVGGLSDDPRLCKSTSDRFGDCVLDSLGTSETYLRLGWMNIDIDLFDRNLEKQEGDRINAVRKNGAKTFEQAAGNGLVANETIVDKKVLRIAGRSAFARS